MNSIKHFGFFRPGYTSRVLAGLIVMSVALTVMAAEDQRSANMGCCRVIELRQYSLEPGQRDVLIDLFDHEFVETQEADGMRIVGQFRDEDQSRPFRLDSRVFRYGCPQARPCRILFRADVETVWKAGCRNDDRL